MAHVPAQHASPTPVFTDPSGRRASALRWLAWTLCAAFAVVVGSVAFTLTTQVPLPGLGGLVPEKPDSTAPRVTPAEKSGPDREAERSSTSTAAPTAVDPGAVAVIDRPTAPDQPAVASSGEGQGSPAVAKPSTTAPAASGSGSTPGSASPGTPSANADPQATSRTRNPNAAARKPSPRVVNEPDEHAAAGHGTADDSVTGASAAPGRNK